MTAARNTMNCAEYKEALGADPSAAFEGGSEHSAGCASCSAFREEMQAFEARIAAALSINTPELKVPDLPEIEADNVVNLAFGGKTAFTSQTWLAVAATVLLAVFVGYRAVGDYYAPSGISLADAVYAHLDHEPGALLITNVAVSNDQLSKVMRRSSGTMDPEIGLVSYATSCMINGKLVPHLVLQGEKGPITLLLMPGEMIDGATILAGKGINGIILPMGDGSIAIIGEHDEPLTELEERIINSVEWNI